MKLDNLSSNVVTVLHEVMQNQEICKYLFYTQSNPQSQSHITDTSQLMLHNLYPYPFNPNVTEADTIQLRVYYPDGKFNQSNVVITDASIFFDIILPESMYLVNDGISRVRPYEIMRLIIDQFSGKSYGTLGIIHFKRFAHMSVNDKYTCIRLIGETMSIGK